MRTRSQWAPMWATLALIGLGSACQKRDAAVAHPDSLTTAAAAPTDTVFRLERTACFGACPTYVATVTAGGEARIEGTGRAAGFHHDATVDPAAVAALLARFETEGFFALDSAYIPGRPLCALYATDHPGAQLFARRGARALEVSHYHGCRGDKDARPEQDRAAPLLLLTALEDAVDSLIGTGAVVDSLRGVR